MDRGLVVDLVQRLPQGVLSRGWGFIARQRRPRLAVSALKRVFVRATGIDLSEAQEGIGDYPTLQDLFIRRLKNGARRIDFDPTAVVSPVDGRVGAFGRVKDDTLLQVKGRKYSLAKLLDDPAQAEAFAGGPYATFYLAPHNYHRIHAPVSGEVRQARLIPGALFPVFPEALEKIDELFARNERLITYLDSPDAGRVAVVKVGATLVGHISVSYDPGLHTNIAGQLARDLSYDPPHPINKGGEVGAFELGSTVVLVGQKDRVSFSGLQEGQAIRMGERIGSIDSRKQRRPSGPANVDEPTLAPTKSPTRTRRTPRSSKPS